MAAPEQWPAEDPLVPRPTVVEPLDTAVAPVTPAGMPPAELADDRFGMGMLVGLLVLLAIGGVVAAVLLTRHHHTAAVTTTIIERGSGGATSPAAGSTAVVPNLIGQSAQEATSVLRSQGFAVRRVTVGGPAPAGAVLGESPAPQAKAAAGSAITLQISNGAAPGTHATPTPTPAVTVTTTAPTHTTPAQTTPAHIAPVATTPAGTTPASSTTAGTSTPAATTTPVTTAPAQTTPTTTAAPPKPASATVPNLSSNQVQAAATTLDQAGFLVTVAYVPGADPLGTVIAQSPSAGATAPTTAHVTINASSGPGQKPQETVPDATGQSIPQAVASMQHAGLRLIFLKQTVSERSLAGKVVAQSPAAGKTAPHNAQVLVYMGAYKQKSP